jgi:hypothetical protein
LSDTTSLSSPKKPDGTTDWDIVFDDPDKGLIALIGRVTSADALEQCGQLIIRRLFTRKNDQLDVARFNRELDDILNSASANGDISVIKAEVVMMLQRIKAIRVAKARAYVDDKARKQKANRRSSGSKAANTYRFINNRKLVAGAVIGSVVVATLLVSFIYWAAVYTPSDTPEIADAGKNPTTEAQIAQERREKAELAAKTEKAEARKQAELQKAEEEKQRQQKIMPAAIVLPGVIIQREINGVMRNLNPIMPIFVLNQRENLSDLCLVRPKLIDIVNVSLSNRISSTATGKTIDYAKTAVTIRDEVNDLLRSDILKDVKLVTDGKSSHMATAGDRCTLATDRYFDYLYPPETK